MVHIPRAFIVCVWSICIAVGFGIGLINVWEGDFIFGVLYALYMVGLATVWWVIDRED
jgi:hypothetical protein